MLSNQAIFCSERTANIEGFEGGAKSRYGQPLAAEARYGEALPLLLREPVLQPREILVMCTGQVGRLARSRSK
jgi:hypothetical protein